MNKEFFEALECLANENSIPVDVLVEKIQQGILKAVRKEYPDCDDFLVDIVPEESKFDVCVMRRVVDDEPIDLNEINIDEARTIVPSCVCGDSVPYKLDTAKFGRVAAQYAKQSIRHDVKEFEKEKLIARYKDKVHEILTATVQKVEPATGNAILLADKNEICLFKNEQIPGETLTEGDIIKIYVVGIVNPERKPSVKISRTHKDLVKRLFEQEIPEIYEGIVEIKSIAREAGSRTKIAVCSKDPDVDCVGACIGAKRSRIGKIVEELGGEKIDIIVYDEDPAVFIAKALAPADVVRVEIAEGEDKVCTVIVPNSQLSLAIGNKGQNAKLAARLTGYKIDIKAEDPAE
ncbi:MAG: transcription termination factor NusA [Ruminococcus sp.]|nr:transcription termination factor NusA [Ruminococcus sp.]